MSLILSIGTENIHMKFRISRKLDFTWNFIRLYAAR